MEIKFPKRILLLSPSGTDTKPILDALTSPSNRSSKSKSNAASASTSSPETLATASGAEAEGDLIHHIQTPYYTAKVPIWVDKISDIDTWEREWRDMEGANEVVEALGAVVVGVRKDAEGKKMDYMKTLLTRISSTISHHLSSSYIIEEPLLLSIILPSHPQTLDSSIHPSSHDLDDLGREAGGWEIIDTTDTRSQNEYGEKIGIPRMLEALEAVEWESPGAANEDIDLDIEMEAEMAAAVKGIEGEDVKATLLKKEREKGVLGAGVEDLSSLEREIQAAMGEKATGEMMEPILAGATAVGKRKASGELDDSSTERKEEVEDGNGKAGVENGKDAKGDKKEEGEGDEEDVEDLQRFLSHFQAVRDMGADLPEAERKRLAARAVREVMRGI